MNKSRFTSKELFALQAVYRGCNTNKRLVGTSYVQNFGTPEQREISYYDALGIIRKMIDEELEKEGKYNE